MLSGKFFSMYIHSNEPAPKQSPQAANCQLPNNENQNSRFHPKGNIFSKANFSSTCPADSNTH